jgi:hypothetical protein
LAGAASLDDVKAHTSDFKSDWNVPIIPAGRYPKLARYSAFAPLLRDIPQRTMGRAESTSSNILFSIVYLVRGDDVVIIAVAHHKRRPGYWADRTRAV